jgi:hypothetical protein
MLPLSPVISNWTAPYGIFFNWGSWDNLSWYDYETTKSPETLSTVNLFKIANGRCAKLRTTSHARAFPHAAAGQ